MEQDHITLTNINIKTTPWGRRNWDTVEVMDAFQDLIPDTQHPLRIG